MTLTKQRNNNNTTIQQYNNTTTHNTTTQQHNNTTTKFLSPLSKSLCKPPTTELGVSTLLQCLSTNIRFRRDLRSLSANHYNITVSALLCNKPQANAYWKKKLISITQACYCCVVGRCWCAVLLRCCCVVVLLLRCCAAVTLLRCCCVIVGLLLRDSCVVVLHDIL